MTPVIYCTVLYYSPYNLASLKNCGLVKLKVSLSVLILRPLVQVCGTDGLTYNNLCELQNQAAVRVDYPGTCVANGTNLEVLCEQVISEGRCTIKENCRKVVLPEDGCCPICGKCSAHKGGVPEGCDLSPL